MSIRKLRPSSALHVFPKPAEPSFPDRAIPLQEFGLELLEASRRRGEKARHARIVRRLLSGLAAEADEDPRARHGVDVVFTRGETLDLSEHDAPSRELVFA